MYPMDPNNRNTEAASAMMIANPFGSLKNMLSTHPPMDQRIARLQQQAREMGAVLSLFFAESSGRSVSLYACDAVLNMTRRDDYDPR